MNISEKPITKVKPPTTDILYEQTFRIFMALRTDASETPNSLEKQQRDILRPNSSLV
jgi:hypothetical protein